VRTTGAARFVIAGSSRFGASPREWIRAVADDPLDAIAGGHARALTGYDFKLAVTGSQVSGSGNGARPVNNLALYVRPFEAQAGEIMQIQPVLRLLGKQASNSYWMRTLFLFACFAAWTSPGNSADAQKADLRIVPGQRIGQIALALQPMAVEKRLGKPTEEAHALGSRSPGGPVGPCMPGEPSTPLLP
jgi:hypothetical protein